MDYNDLDENGTSLNMFSKWSLKEVKPGMLQESKSGSAEHFIFWEKDQLINITSLPDLGHSTVQVQLLLWTCPDSGQSVRQFLTHFPRSPVVHQDNQGVHKIIYKWLYLSINSKISMICSVILRGQIWSGVGWGWGSYCSHVLYFSK